MHRLLPLLLLFAAPIASQSKAVAVEGGTVHTMVLGQEPSIQDILIVDGRVTQVGLGLEYPEGTERVDASGMHVIPALIDGQVHFDVQHDLLYTANGIGLIRDVGGEYIYLLRARDDPARNAGLAPKMITSGKLIDVDSKLSSASALIETPADAQRAIAILSEAGIDFVSISHRLTNELRAKVIEYAHAAGLKVWSAVPLEQDLDSALAEGLDGILELNSVRPRTVGWDIVLPPAFLAPARKLAELKTPVIPMFLANQIVLEDQQKNPATKDFMRLISPVYRSRWLSNLEMRLAQFGSDTSMYDKGKTIITKQIKLLKQLHEKGVRLVPGSGSPSPWLFPGIALHQEMAFWAHAGIPDADILAAATRVAAEAFGVQEDFGSIQPGRYGSLVLVAEDPTESIVALRTPKMILCRGIVLEEDDINAIYQEILMREEVATEQLAKRIEIPEPLLPENAKLLLEGRSNTHSSGLPISSEHFRVARLPDGALVFSSNIGFPRRPNKRDRRTEIYQVVKDGALQEIRIVVSIEGLDPLIMEGKWVASSWRMQRTQGGKPAANLVTDSRCPEVIEVGSVTTLMMLGQLKADPARPIQVVAFLENLEPVVIQWQMALDDKGNHLLRTPQGITAFHFNETGAVLQGRRRIGTEMIDFELDTSDSFGGAGLPLPAEKQARVDGLVQTYAKARAAAIAELEARQAAEAAAKSPSTDLEASDSPPATVDQD